MPNYRLTLTRGAPDETFALRSIVRAFISRQFPSYPTQVHLERHNGVLEFSMPEKIPGPDPKRDSLTELYAEIGKKPWAKSKKYEISQIG